MKISRLKDCPLDESIAYLIGLMYPLIRISDDKKYIFGVIASNSGKITEAKKKQHIENIFSFLEKYDIDREEIEIIEDFSYSGKNAFALKFDIDEDPIEILNNKVSEILESNEEVKKFFLKGCFDGRSSFDTTNRWIALSVDKDDSKSDNILQIARNLDFVVENNKSRNKPYHQIRIKNNVLDYKSRIGFFSIVRNEVIQ